jgi:hypothetical protein
MLLGRLIASLEDEAVAERALATLDDVALALAVERTAEAEGVGPGRIATEAVASYAAEADDEEWTTLVGLLARSGDPGTTLLRRALARVFAHLGTD